MKKNKILFNIINYGLVLNLFCTLAPIKALAQEYPSSTPELFEIRANVNHAKLFFTPITNTSTFMISFSTYSHAEEHGEKVILGSDGVQTHTIYNLAPATTYYLKVRGDKNDLAGSWSNILAFTTLSSANTQNATYYLHGEKHLPTNQTYATSSPTKKDSNSDLPSTNVSNNEKITQNIEPADKKIVSPTEEPKASEDIIEENTAEVVEPAEVITNITKSEALPTETEKKEKCFLWWCW